MSFKLLGIQVNVPPLDASAQFSNAVQRPPTSTPTMPSPVKNVIMHTQIDSTDSEYEPSEESDNEEVEYIPFVNKASK